MVGGAADRDMSLFVVDTEILFCVFCVIGAKAREDCKHDAAHARTATSVALCILILLLDICILLWWSLRYCLAIYYYIIYYNTLLMASFYSNCTLKIMRVESVSFNAINESSSRNVMHGGLVNTSTASASYLVSCYQPNALYVVIKFPLVCR